MIIALMKAHNSAVKEETFPSGSAKQQIASA